MKSKLIHKDFKLQGISYSENGILEYLKENAGIENSSISDKKIEEETIFDYFYEKMAQFRS